VSTRTAGALRGLLARLSLVFHVVELAEREVRGEELEPRDKAQVSAATVKRAATFIRKIALPNLFRLGLSGFIIDPTDADEVVGDVLQSVMAYVWADPEAKRIRFRAARPADETIVALDDQSHILADSFSRRVEMAEQVSRAEVWRDVLDGTEALDDPRNYRSPRITLGEQFGLPRIRVIASRWLKTEGQAALTGSTLLQASGEPPVYVTVEVGAKDAHRVGPGTPVRLTTRNLQDETGLAKPALFIVTEAVERGGERVRLTMRSIGGFPGISNWTGDSAPNWATATDEQKTEQAFWTDENGLISGENPRSVWT